MTTTENKPEPELDWAVDCSDDEKYDPAGLGNNKWQPKPDDIKTLYRRLANGEILTIEWQCRGRRSPTPERQEEKINAEPTPEEEPKTEEITAPTEFDFDDDFGTDSPSTVTPRRTPGSAKTPRTQTKRVARLDKIMEDIRRHRKINAEADKSASSDGNKSKPSQNNSNSTAQKSTPKGNMSPKKLS